MTPREIDALIATHVFGAKLVYSAFSEDKTVVSCDFPDRKLGMAFSGLPKFSERIECAWLVVEKMREKGICMEVAAYPDHRTWLKPDFKGQKASEWTLKETPEKYQATAVAQDFEKLGTYDWFVVADPVSMTAPMAICLAALKALGVEIK